MTKEIYDAIGLDNPRIIIDWVNLPSVLHINSFTNITKSYKISPHDNNCSCPDFVETRFMFAKNDPRRTCKHLNRYFYENGILQKQSELTQVIMTSPTRGPYLATMKFSTGMIFSISFEENGWKSVFTRRRKKEDAYLGYTGLYDQYGYNQRWSYGLAPPGGKVLRDAIHQIKEYIIANNIPKFTL